MDKKNAIITISLRVPFHGYKTNILNKRALEGILNWTRETIKNELRFIPLYVEKDEYGSFIEDVTLKSSIAVKGHLAGDFDRPLEGPRNL